MSRSQKARQERRDTAAREELAERTADLGRIDLDALRRLQDRWKQAARSGTDLRPRLMLREVNAELAQHEETGRTWEEMAWDDDE